MKTVVMAALVFLGTNLVAPPAGAIPPGGSSSAGSSDLIQVANKNSKKLGKKHNYSASKGYIPGYVLTPYGRGDCIGWWEPIGNGMMRCHGQFLPYRY